ncbi:peptidylprolyl isomerase [Paraglaciecola sp. 25GB23A]|uniref:peptidylprolyl isomerase n=1 Tax=Paraglaciecola sp. 25GB23A TaxID=3156068 RepID=UPI0032AF6A2A
MLRLRLRPTPKFRHYVLPLLLMLSGGTSTVLFAAEPAMQEATIYTNVGDINIELYIQQAPITVANFVRYIQAGAYEGGSFYRVVRLDNDNGSPKIEVIQGGANPDFKDFAPIPLENTEKTGIKHLDGVLSMARGEPNSATQAFFICIGEQPALDKGALRNPDGQGFAAFARVISGMEVVKLIHQNRDAIEVDDPYIQGQILSEPVTILKISLQN